MSATNRGRRRVVHDYYVTPLDPIRTFLHAWMDDCPEARDVIATGPILDPCAGGNKTAVKWRTAKREVHTKPTDMSYPATLREFTDVTVETNDIRKDSPALHHENFLEVTFNQSGDGRSGPRPKLIISNPPFFLAREFIGHALECVASDGYVAFLLRLNFLETEDRFRFFQHYMPHRIYVHHKRMSFTGDGKTDSVAYMHAVWKRGPNTTSKTRVI